ncbi:MAG TPA: glycoside hydrolase family 9 protein [Candidatus Angelobacter sp.]|nr:glycoside hydrolase family 9 protein [Candidatus Angelobacter sp.]
MATPFQSVTAGRGTTIVGVLWSLLLVAPLAADSPLTNDVSLAMPAPGSYQLRVLEPDLLELDLINTKAPDPARVAVWDYVSDTSQLQLPAPQDFAVTVGAQPALVQSVGFKRRVLYAPLKQRDLRIGNSVYLKLASPVTEGQIVEVNSLSAGSWPVGEQFVTTMDPLRFNPAIHVNQVGYVPSFPKRAMVGYYLGSLGEMDIPASVGFKLVNVRTGSDVYQGSLTPRPDVGYTYTPTPYQKVFEADFSSFSNAGEYKLVVPGLGASLPFLIDDGSVMAFVRTYALGLYHQRCGTSNALPFTRFVHGACHVAPAAIPLPSSSFAFTWNTISNYAAQANSDNPPQQAPRLMNEASQLYPFVNTGQIDVSGGHHDAGDYSKYTINSAALIHYLVFAVDAFTGVGALDNLGIPESGDGKSDLLQEAKWEADFLAKMQDADGGFYFLVYPRNREYENNVLPDRGDPQVVWPKNTAVTAAAVAALAQCGSSPLFKKQFPDAATNYLAKAQLGWSFLTNAIARYGKAGAYQKLTHYGDEFTHDDELAWAACELFLATGAPAYHQQLMEWYDPGDAATVHWGWWRLFEGYGCAARSYALAVKTGRRKLNELDPIYLTKCQNEVVKGAEDQLRWAQNGAYGASFPSETKRVRDAGWFFCSERAFDIAVAYQLFPRSQTESLVDPRHDYLDAILGNLNYEGGCNPVNVTYLTGLGWKRQREIVHQYAQNDRRVLPPTGIPLGNIQSGFQYINNYGSELGALVFPPDGAAVAPYPYYDRWADTFNTSTEFVAVDQARALASLAFVATLTSAATQSWNTVTAQITGLPVQGGLGSPVTAGLQVVGMDLTNARVVWEARDQEPDSGNTFTFSPINWGTQWVEAEVQWPNGRRAFAATNFVATNNLPTVTVVSTIAQAFELGQKPGEFTIARTGDTSVPLTVNYQFSGTALKWDDYRRPQGDVPESITIPVGETSTKLTLVPVDDKLLEGPETIILTISTNAVYNTGPSNRATIIIQDNELPPHTSTGPDSDGDGLSDTDEGVAGTDVHNADSVFKIVSLVRDQSGNVTITWNSVPGKSYLVACKDNAEDTFWSDVSGPITSGGATTSWTDINAGRRPRRIYCIVVT